MQNNAFVPGTGTNFMPRLLMKGFSLVAVVRADAADPDGKLEAGIEAEAGVACCPVADVAVSSNTQRNPSPSPFASAQ